MRLVDIVSGAWAITPAMHREILGIYQRHIAGPKIDLDGLAAQIGKPLKSEPKGYAIEERVAILPIEGVIAKRMNLLTYISGGTSTSFASAEFAKAMNDPAVDSIILLVDSPGGAVDGTQEFANVIESFRGTKPIVAFTDGMIASAAYWIAAAADRIYISGDTTQVGSIGVVATHTDLSGAEAQRGIRTTEITAGRFKRIASSYAPLTPEGRASIQDHVDSIYTAFVSDVARMRGSDVNTVLEKMADGKIFIGKSAIGVGLVDGVSTLGDIIAGLTDGSILGRQQETGAVATVAEVKPEAGMTSTQTIQKEKPEMDIETLKAEHPELMSAIKAEGFEEGSAFQLERVKAVFAQTMTGHDALIKALALDGKTSGPEAAQAIITAENQARAKNLVNLSSDAPKPVDFQADQEVPKLTGEAKWKADWKASQELREEFNGNENAYLKFMSNSESGRIRVAMRTKE